jgi:hypothetical protein
MIDRTPVASLGRSRRYGCEFDLTGFAEHSEPTARCGIPEAETICNLSA